MLKSHIDNENSSTNSYWCLEIDDMLMNNHFQFLDFWNFCKNVTFFPKQNLTCVMLYQHFKTLATRNMDIIQSSIKFHFWLMARKIRIFSILKFRYIFYNVSIWTSKMTPYIIIFQEIKICITYFSVCEYHVCTCFIDENIAKLM